MSVSPEQAGAEPGPQPSSEPVQELGPAEAARQRWLSVLAKARLAELESAWDGLADPPAYDWLRQPEIGMVMLRARSPITFV